MKDKKQKITVIFGIICAVIIGVCLVIQFVIKKEDGLLLLELVFLIAVTTLLR